MALKYDLTGMRFGKYTVIRLYGRNKSSVPLWECKCDCLRSIHIVQGQDLRSGRVSQCKLCALEQRKGRKRDTGSLNGRKFGKLIVLYKSDNKDARGSRWICECTCEAHSIVEVARHALTEGRVTQCYQCAQLSRVKKTSGSNHYAWRGGISFGKYCPLFNESLKEKIRDRYGRQCFICGKEEGKRHHHVHHVDYHKNQGCHGRGWSLIPLCASCHAKTNHHRYYWFNLLYPLTLQVSTADYELIPNWGELNLNLE